MATVIAGALIPGCVHEPVCVDVCEDSEFYYGNELAWLSPVTIVPVSSEATDRQVLMAFCTELATTLRDRGVAEVDIRNDGPQPCEAKSPEQHSWPVRDAGPPASLLMFVALPDFQAYRPMRMAVDVRVVQPQDERELIRVVDVFVGPQETPLRETPREIRLFRDREREETADREAYTAFHTNSPRWFLTDNARRVTDRLSFVEPPASTATLPNELPAFSAEPSPFPIEVPTQSSPRPSPSLAPPGEPPMYPFAPPMLPDEPLPLPGDPPTFPGDPTSRPQEPMTIPDEPGRKLRPAPRLDEQNANVPFALLSCVRVTHRPCHTQTVLH